MNKLYEEPKMEVIYFTVEDVICTSGVGGLDEDELPLVPANDL